MPGRGVSLFPLISDWAILQCKSKVLLVQVKFKHLETGAYLSSSGDKRYGRPISGQLEVCGKNKAGKVNEFWIATEGVYFPTTSDV